MYRKRVAAAGGLSGVLISVTTVPAAGNVALGLAFGAGHEIWGSALRLVVNLTGMAVAGWLTLAVQEVVWARMSARRTRILRWLRGGESGGPERFQPPMAGSGSGCLTLTVRQGCTVFP
jgi:Domain of unknown function (DUF389)